MGEVVGELEEEEAKQKKIHIRMLLDSVKMLFSNSQLQSL